MSNIVIAQINDGEQSTIVKIAETAVEGVADAKTIELLVIHHILTFLVQIHNNLLLHPHPHPHPQ